MKAKYLAVIALALVSCDLSTPLPDCQKLSLESRLTNTGISATKACESPVAGNPNRVDIRSLDFFVGLNPNYLRPLVVLIENDVKVGGGNPEYATPQLWVDIH